MIWIFPALVAVAIVYFAMRYVRFRNLTELLLSLAVAAGLISAFIVWINDGGRNSTDVVSPLAPAAPTQLITPEQVVLTDLQFVQGNPTTSYRVTGTMRNNSAAFLEHFNLTVVMDDCPGGTCTPLAQDRALVLARLAPGQSSTFSTALTLRISRLAEPVDVQWRTEVDGIRAVER